MTTTDVSDRPVGDLPGEAPAGGAPAPGGRSVTLGHGELLHAIRQNLEENSVTLDIAGVGKVRLPAADSLAWLGGMATLAALGILEWPVAVAIGVGHLLSRQRHIRLLEEFGRALEDA